jgi:gas vesicle protein
VGEESEQLRREIDQTRAELGTDVDALTEKVSPKRVVERRVDKTKDAIGGLKEKVMGTTSDVTSSTGNSLSGAASSVQGGVSNAASSVQGGVQNAASTVGDTASTAAVKTKRAAQGNPLAAGVVAFGLGWLVSSLLPASQKERELAHQVKDQAQPAVQAVGQQAGQVLNEVKGNLQEPAQQAVQSVKETATDAADTVKGEAQSAASDVKGQAQDSGQQLREQAPTPS